MSGAELFWVCIAILWVFYQLAKLYVRGDRCPHCGEDL